EGRAVRVGEGRGRDVRVERPDAAEDLGVTDHVGKVLRALLRVVHAVHRVVVWLVRDLEALDVAVELDRVRDARLRAAAARAVGARCREVARDDDLALVGTTAAGWGAWPASGGDVRIPA